MIHLHFAFTLAILTMNGEKNLAINYFKTEDWNSEED